MNTGLGFSEMLLIVTLILIFFGSKELPVFIRKAAQFMAKIRHYSEKLRGELDSISRSVEKPMESNLLVSEKKKQLRNRYISLRKSIEQDDLLSKSEEIFKHLNNTDEFRNATAVMIYVSTGNEVHTHKMIIDMIKSGKKVAVPYCVNGRNDLGLAEIRDFENDLLKGELGILEPRPELRDHFFRSDLQLIICPGVAFDIFGSRLGRGKAYYDNFLKEIKGKIPIAGLAFDCQISKEPLPFDYHDILMDQIITETGLQLQKTALISPLSSPGELAG